MIFLELRFVKFILLAVLVQIPNQCRVISHYTRGLHTYKRVGESWNPWLAKTEYKLRLQMYKQSAAFNSRFALLSKAQFIYFY